MAKKTRAAAAPSTVLDYLKAIRDSRQSMCEIRERMYQRIDILTQQNGAASKVQLDEASLNLEEAKIQLAQAEIAVLDAP